MVEKLNPQYEAKTMPGLTGSIRIDEKTFQCKIFVKNEHTMRRAYEYWGLHPEKRSVDRIGSSASHGNYFDDFVYQNGKLEFDLSRNTTQKIPAIFESERSSFSKQSPHGNQLYVIVTIPDAAKNLITRTKPNGLPVNFKFCYSAPKQFWRRQIRYLTRGSVSMYNAQTRDWILACVEELEKLHDQEEKSTQSKREMGLIEIIEELMDPDTDLILMKFSDGDEHFSKNQLLKLGGYFSGCLNNNMQENMEGEIDLTNSLVTKDLFLRGYLQFELHKPAKFSISETCCLANFAKIRCLPWFEKLSKVLESLLTDSEKVIELFQQDLSRFDPGIRLLQLNAAKKMVFSRNGNTDRQMNAARDCFFSLTKIQANAFLKMNDLDPPTEKHIFDLVREYYVKKEVIEEDDQYSLFECVRFDLLGIEDLFKIRTESKEQDFATKVNALLKKSICMKAKPDYKPVFRKRRCPVDPIDRRTRQVLELAGILE